MPSRRKVLSLAAVGTLSSIAGCSSLGDGSADPLPVAVLLDNDDTEAQTLRVVITDGSDERVFETTETIPADDGAGTGRVRIDSAFAGTPGDDFTVRAWFGGESAGTFDYEVTCPEDNYVALLVEHRSHRSDGVPVHYNDHWCAK
jgi:hypothetical protein